MDSQRPQIIGLPRVRDPRGNLSFIESRQHVPFAVKRVYWLYDVPGGTYRNGHAFRTQDEMIVALSGSFDVVLNDGTAPVRHHLSRSYYGLLVPRMTWRTIDNFSTNSVVLVLSSTRYDAADYIEDFTQYKREKLSATPAKQPLEREPLAEPLPLADALCATQTHVDDCRLIELPRHHHANGNLTVVELGDAASPCGLERVFYLYDIPGGEERGGHAHRRLTQCIVAISGSFDVALDDAGTQRVVTLNRPWQALVVSPGVWNTLGNFSSGAVCMVLASHPYEENDYIRNYDEFLAFKQINRI